MSWWLAEDRWAHASRPCWPAARVGPFGAWETTAGVDAVVQALLVLLLLAGPFVLWASLR